MKHSKPIKIILAVTIATSLVALRNLQANDQSEMSALKTSLETVIKARNEAREQMETSCSLGFINSTKEVLYGTGKVWQITVNGVLELIPLGGLLLSAYNESTLDEAGLAERRIYVATSKPFLKNFIEPVTGREVVVPNLFGAILTGVGAEFTVLVNRAQGAWFPRSTPNQWENLSVINTSLILGRWEKERKEQNAECQAATNRFTSGEELVADRTAKIFQLILKMSGHVMPAPTGPSSSDSPGDSQR